MERVIVVSLLSSLSMLGAACWIDASTDSSDTAELAVEALRQCRDDPSTYGDDRRGYQACGTITCGPGTNCCPEGPSCIDPAENCGYPRSLGNECDGAEDCAPGLTCYATLYGNACADTPDAVSFVVCHTDDDCVDAVCPGSGTPCPVCTLNEQTNTGTCFWL